MILINSVHIKIKSQRIVDIIRVRDAFNYVYVCQLYLRPGELKKRKTQERRYDIFKIFGF